MSRLQSTFERECCELADPSCFSSRNISAFKATYKHCRKDVQCFKLLCKMLVVRGLEAMCDSAHCLEAVVFVFGEVDHHCLFLKMCCVVSRRGGMKPKDIFCNIT